MSESIYFSYSTQAFYDGAFIYPDLPPDIVSITPDQHQQLLDALNAGCKVLPDLTTTEPRPSQFHLWDEGNLRWIDPRTDEEIAAHTRSLLAPLNKRQFNLYMFDHQLTDSLNAVFTSYPREKVEFDSTDRIERLSPTVKTISDAMGWTDEQVDLMWNDALAL